MALPTASDNVFPKVVVSEQTTPASPSAGQQKLFLDSGDHKLKRVNSSGTVTVIEGGSNILFDSTLGVDTASIDTGVSGIASGFAVLEMWILARTDDAVVIGSVSLTLNNDTGANYDRHRFQAANTTVTGATGLAQTAWAIETHGASASASFPSVTRITIPGYTQTTFFKTGEMTNASPDSTAANNNTTIDSLAWRSTSAISRAKIAVAGGGTVLKAGTRFLIMGR